jgi:hypothetical protein
MEQLGLEASYNLSFKMSMVKAAQKTLHLCSAWAAGEVSLRSRSADQELDVLIG